MEAEGGSDQWVGRSAAKVGESIKDIVDFDPVAFLESLPSYFLKTMNAYIFCNKDLVPDYLNWALKSGYAFNILFWKKPNALPLGSQHRPDTEYIIFIRKNAIWNNGLEGVNYSKALEFGRENSTTHPTMKPIGLISNELLISSNKNGIVVDPFLGSGSTLIAAEQTGRVCYGFELEPKYCDIILKRWETLTGQTAQLLSKTL
jgi:DNA modification methylase